MGCGMCCKGICVLQMDGLVVAASTVAEKFIVTSANCSQICICADQSEAFSSSADAMDATGLLQFSMSSRF